MSEMPTVQVLLRQYATLIKTYADAVAENARLKAAMDKYSEDEVMGEIRGELLLGCCIEICQEESTDNGTAQKIEARIRALPPKVERREAKRRVSIEEYFGTGRRFLKDRRKA